MFHKPTQWLALLSTILISSMALATPMTYEIASYSTQGYSASWIHAADGCASTGPSGGTLYMCAENRIDLHALTGTITGDLVGGVLSITGGSLQAAGLGSFDIISGTLGGAFAAFWNINTSIGNLLFENLAMGTGKPNLFDGSQFVLWGQTKEAYIGQGMGFGADIYAQAVPEPGTWIIMGIGFGALFLARRHQKMAYLQRTTRS